jgi:hypothetical protein
MMNCMGVLSFTWRVIRAAQSSSSLRPQEQALFRTQRQNIVTDSGGTLNGRWVPHDTRDEVVDYVRRWNARTEIPAKQFVGWLGIGQSKFHDWKDRYGKLERFHGSIKGECIRPGTPISLEDAVRIAGRYVEHYNRVRLHSAIAYVAPADKLAGREAEIFAGRDRKLFEARERRKEQREAARLRTVA